MTASRPNPDLRGDIPSVARPPAFPDAGGLRASLCNAHARSQRFGLDPRLRPDDDLLPASELKLQREQSRVLCRHALPVMEALHAQATGAPGLIVLTDAQGLVLHAMGDDDFMRQAARVALRPGATWTERRRGTNAIGTALAERRPTIVHGSQHYLAANRFLSCSSAPILGPHGDLLGVLDMTADHRGPQEPTLALAKLSALMIEDHLFAGSFGDALQIAFHPRPEILGSLMAGIAAFTHDGRFLAANRNAQTLLGLPPAALRAHTLPSLFGFSGAQLIDRAGSDRPLLLELGNGTLVHAHVRSNRSPLATAGRPADTWTASATTPRTGPSAMLPLQANLRPTLDQLDTGDAQIAAVIAKLRRVIGKDLPILVTGETGTGKELLAQAIHADSPRGSGPFVALNCASIPETLIESELFGYEEGAFTGARRKGAAGKLLQANGGTLFLDEIGDMPYPLQARLLRVLQERVVNPLGSSKSIPVDIAIICATHRDLRGMISQNRFRADLYYRLNGLTVRLPPLRDRTDLAALIQRQLQCESAHHARGQRLRIAPDVMALFKRYAWPGNFRQLLNVLRAASAMAEEDGQIKREHLPDDFLDDLHVPPATPETSALADGKRLRDATASIVAATLARHGGNVSAAARALGVSRNAIYRKMGERPAAARLPPR